jgi:hypothetical protein
MAGYATAVQALAATLTIVFGIQLVPGLIKPHTQTVSETGIAKFVDASAQAACVLTEAGHASFPVPIVVECIPRLITRK